jgi:hypothetical protein
VALAEPFREDRVDRPALHLACGVTEQLLGTGVPEPDHAVAVEEEHGVAQRVDDPLAQRRTVGHVHRSPGGGIGASVVLTGTATEAEPCRSF